jgi:DNA-nicking Smr family endonuclease
MKFYNERVVKMSEMEPVELPIDGVLDLHLFSPKELGDLIPVYIEACLEKEIYSIRIIHGKGKGVLRKTVHGLLDKNPHVESYSLATDRSGWGATVAELVKDN